MKKIYLYLFLVGITISCEKQELNQLPEENLALENKPYLEVIDFKDLPLSILESIDKQEIYKTSVHESNYFFGRIRQDMAAKMIVNKDGNVSYTMVLETGKNALIAEPSDFYFDNLVIQEMDKGQNLVHIIRYIPTEDWINNSRDFNDFTGIITFYLPTGEKINSFNMTGEEMNSHNAKNNRKAECVLVMERGDYICVGDVEETTSGEVYGDGEETCFPEYNYKWECIMGSGDGDFEPSDPSPEEPDGLPRTGGSTTPTYPKPEEVDVAIGINDTSLDSCLKVILSTLEGHFHGVGKIIAELAESDTSFTWTVESGSLAGETAITDTNFDSASNSTTTTFDSQGFPRGTDLSWARTILHESVHAYVVGISNTSTLAERQELLGPNWTIAYFNYGHDYIAETYVNSMADILQEYGQLKGYTMDRQFYEDLAWGGLQGTNAFNSLSTTVKNRILDVSAIELTGKDRFGTNKTQKGSDAGC